MELPLTGVPLNDRDFGRISKLVKELCGINLHAGKKQLVKARLAKRLRFLKLPSFDAYLRYLANDTSGNELVTMLDAISTNLTHFFRESAHFDYMRQMILPRFKQRPRGAQRIRIWSAGCSSGEEPYSIAMVLAEEFPDQTLWDMKILATDLSTQVLQRASQGAYPAERLQGMPKLLIQRHFTRQSTGGDDLYRISDALRKMVTFGRLNLMDQWPMKGPFDIIFCRNVMIYFDKTTQGKLVDRFCDLLGPRGTLFIGHSESLTGTTHNLKYIRPTVYEKA